MEECVSLLGERAKECLETLLRTSKSDLLSALLEKREWRKCFVANYSSHLLLLKENIKLGAERVRLKYNEETDH